MKFTNYLLKFRTHFSYPAKDVTHFFPSHMARGLDRMQQKLRKVHCVIEVVDSRIPLSGRNPRFSETLAGRPHLLILNKMDLVDKSMMRKSEDRLRQEYGVKHIMYANCKVDQHVTIKEKLIPKLSQLFGGERSHTTSDHYNLMVIGLPNVGKSSLINALRRVHIGKSKGTAVGPHAGVTKNVLERIRVCDHPTIFVYDSPGIMAPNIKDMDVGMKLALCATLTDHVVGPEIITDYMLFWMNSHKYFNYVDYFNLPEPTDDILQLLSMIARKENAVQRLKSATGEYLYKPNFDYAAKIALQAFRDGKLGLFNLDEDLLHDVEYKSS